MWFLIVIVLMGESKDTISYDLTINGPYKSLDKCSKVREAGLLYFNKPKVNYELVCIKSDLK